MDEATTLDRTTRMLGFAVCVGMGLLFSFLSPMFIFRPTKFAVLYTLGNVLSIFSTMFLVGPFKQIQNMFDPKRAIATVVYLLTMVLTLVAALKFHSVILCVLLIAVQFCALIWYILSYIPYGQAILQRFVPFNLAGGGEGGGV
eukprot:scaffold14.g1241.t1